MRQIARQICHAAVQRFLNRHYFIPPLREIIVEPVWDHRAIQVRFDSPYAEIVGQRFSFDHIPRIDWGSFHSELVDCWFHEILEHCQRTDLRIIEDILAAGGLCPRNSILYNLHSEHSGASNRVAFLGTVLPLDSETHRAGHLIRQWPQLDEENRQEFLEQRNQYLYRYFQEDYRGISNLARRAQNQWHAAYPEGERLIYGLRRREGHPRPHYFGVDRAAGPDRTVRYTTSNVNVAPVRLNAQEMMQAMQQMADVTEQQRQRFQDLFLAQMEDLIHFEAGGGGSQTEAQQRGEKLLKENLDAEQLKDYEKTKSFIVYGGVSGKPYRVEYGTSQNVYELDPKTKKKVQGWCFHPGGGLCAGDVMLAQKLSLELQEEQVMKIANRFGNWDNGVRVSWFGMNPLRMGDVFNDWVT